MICCDGVQVDGDALEKNEDIQQSLEVEKQRKKNEYRILLLGTGDSGKTTIVKQMKILHQGGYSDEERLVYLPLIQKSIIQYMIVLIDACSKLEVHIKKKVNREFARIITTEATDEKSFKLDFAEKLSALWQDGGIRSVYKRRNEFQIGDSAHYYLDNVLLYANPKYLPVDNDILRFRASTTGILQTEFNVGEKKFVVVDVGGQRSERKKWIHCFDDVFCVLYVVGTSEFDQTLFEDNTTNRLAESKKIFHEVCRSKWFSNAMILLFFNKIDLFTEKIFAGKTVKIAFDDYDGDADVDKNIKFLKGIFEDVRDPYTGELKDIITHTTCATDSNNFKIVWAAVYQSILSANLKASGILGD